MSRRSSFSAPAPTAMPPAWQRCHRRRRSSSSCATSRYDRATGSSRRTRSSGSVVACPRSRCTAPDRRRMPRSSTPCCGRDGTEEDLMIETTPLRPTPPRVADGGRKTRVLHVITHLDHGGAQDNTLLTVAGLDRDRYTVDIASGPGVLEDRARSVADNVHLLGSLRRPLLDPGVGSTLLKLAKLSANYDIVHTHGSKAGVLGRIAARMRHVPVIVHTVHGMPVNDFMSAAQRRV